MRARCGANRNFPLPARYRFFRQILSFYKLQAAAVAAACFLFFAAYSQAFATHSRQVFSAPNNLFLPQVGQIPILL